MFARYSNAINRTLIMLLLIPAAAFGIFAQGWSHNVSPLPAPTGHVNDYADVMDEWSRNTLEEKLRSFKEKTGVELAVAIVRTTGDRDIFDYSLAVARGWGIGAKTDDNPGALLLIAIDDRKYFTQISRDLEDELPDGLTGSLQRRYLVPEFRKGDYAKGISDTLDAYIATIEARLSGGPAPELKRTRTEPDTGSGAKVFCFLVVLLIASVLIASNIRRGGGKSPDDQDRWGGGSGSGGFMEALPWIVLSGISSSSSDSSSSWSDWGSSGGSSWGGFGGGGDFGGGGAGGSW